MSGTEQTMFSREDLDLIEPEDLDADLDAEEARGNDAMRRLGMSDDEIARARGKASPADLAKPPPSLADVERELAEISKYRRAEKHKYFRDEAAQKRELALLEQQAKLKAQGATADPDEGERLGDDLPEALREAWAKEPDGIAGNIAAVRSRTVLALGELAEDEHDGLLESFDNDLSDDERTVIAEQLSQDHGGAWKPATDAEVGAFAETEWGALTLERWGRQGPKLLGVAKKEADGILGRLTATSRLKVERWAMSKSVSQRAALVEVLAARAVRKL